jgi:predicted MarR family transcription regulator
VVAKQTLSHTCCALLHVIGLKNRPKTTAEVTRLLNRVDLANVQYSIRKLEQAGLVERCSTGRRRRSCYRVTRRGRRASYEYAELRAQVLMSRIPSVEHWDDQIDSAERLLDLMRGIYDQAALMLATHRNFGEA